MEGLLMNSIKKINLLFCLVLSFVFLLGNVFSVQAESIQKQQTLNFGNEQVLLNERNKKFLEKDQKRGFYDRNNIDFNVCI